MEKTYRELTEEERQTTYANYQALCELHSEMIPFDSFESYDKEQMFLDLNFDAVTLECLG